MVTATLPVVDVTSAVVAEDITLGLTGAVPTYPERVTERERRRLAFGDPPPTEIEGYNRDDCLSTLRLAVWLEQRWTRAAGSH